MPKTSAQSNGIPAAPDTSVQFNDGGSFGGDASLTWNKTTNILTTERLAVNAPSGSGDILAITAANDSPYALTFTNALNPTALAGFFLDHTGLIELDSPKDTTFYSPGTLTLSADTAMALNTGGGITMAPFAPNNVTIFGPLLVTQDTTSANTGAQTYESRVIQNYDAADGNPSLDGKNIFSAEALIGHTTPAVGTVLPILSGVTVEGSANALNETANYFGLTNVKIGTGYTQTTGPTGKYWIFDMQLNGPIAVQPNGLNGVSTLINNYYNGSPAQNNSSGMTITTKKGVGNGDATHLAANTFPLDVGLQIVGVSDVGGVTGIGWTTGIIVGGTGGPWQPAASKIGTGIHVRDYQTAGIAIDNQGLSTAPDITMTGFWEGFEMTAPAAGAANSGRLFFQDNGAGKTQLMVKFNTGAAQQIAIQP